jgi:hypothetical protein
MKPKTYEVVVYDDGTSAVSEFDRGVPGNESALFYVGRDFRDREATARLVEVLRSPIAVFTTPRVAEAPGRA